MSNEYWKKRYSFRLTEDDKDIYDFIERSKESNSETIRKLLKFAIAQLHIEKKKREEEKFNAAILQKIEELTRQQKQHHLEIMDKLNNGIIVNDSNSNNDDEEQEKVNKSVENSFFSMLESFGMDD